jgi:SNF2 family DNA or RNA helicase
MILRDYQIQASKQGKEILFKNHLVYLAFEVRTGKTLIALTIANDFKDVLFVTKKKAISSIEKDFKAIGYTYNLTIVNYESLHKVGKEYDCIIIDEAHGIGGFPKKSKRLNDLQKIKSNYHILLSGTPTPESWSQIYHQLAVSKHSPFKEWINFYKWAHHFVNIKKKYVSNGLQVNDYSDADLEKIKPFVSNIMITKTQKETGFINQINEKCLYVKMQPKTYTIANRLQKELVLEGKSGIILADTPVKLQSKLHQIYSGTVKLECGKKITLDLSKAHFIKDRFKDKKIAIFYKYQQELEVLIQVFGNDLTADINEFNNSGKNIAGQILSIREGTNLSKADAIVFYNLDFSNVSYKQARDRMTTAQRKQSDVYFIFSYGGIEEKIYKTVTVHKKKYDLSAFKKDYF